MMATAALDKRTRAEVIVDTIAAFTSAGAGSPSNQEEAGACAARLGVPVGLVWLAVDGLNVEQIDALVAWWPRKEGA